MQHHFALDIAKTVVGKLQEHCDRIHIAGSIRRNKPEVKDIEIICQPKTEMRGADLFGTGGSIERIVPFKLAAITMGKILKGNPVNGKYMQIVLPEGINLDLFMPDAHDYYRQYAIRTGSADYAAKVIATGWRKIGWCGSDKGLRPTKDCYEKKDGQGKSSWHCTNPHAATPPHWQSEEDFFNWIQVPWIEPHLREI